MYKKLYWIILYNALAYICLLMSLSIGDINEQSNGEGVTQIVHLCLVILTFPINFVSLAMIFAGTASVLTITLVQTGFLFFSILMFGRLRSR